MSVDDHFSGSFSTPNTPFKNHFKIIRWHPPIPGRTKLNFDGSLQGALAAGGFILRDWRGALLLAGASHYGNTSVAMAESRALWEGIQAALTAGYTSFDIEGDNALVIAAVKNDGGLPWRITTVISDIRHLLLQAPSATLTHVYREANLAADWLSKFGHTSTGIWADIDFFNVDFRAIVNDDRIGRSLVRRAA